MRGKSRIKAEKRRQQAIQKERLTRVRVITETISSGIVSPRKLKEQERHTRVREWRKTHPNGTSGELFRYLYDAKQEE